LRLLLLEPLLDFDAIRRAEDVLLAKREAICEGGRLLSKVPSAWRDDAIWSEMSPIRMVKVDWTARTSLAVWSVRGSVSAGRMRMSRGWPELTIALTAILSRFAAGGAARTMTCPECPASKAFLMLATSFGLESTTRIPVHEENEVDGHGHFVVLSWRHVHRTLYRHTYGRLHL
jgi:hypothetical protein